jgi:hypothetical protein
MTEQEALNTFLSEQKYMTIAVTLTEGTPWATPVRIKRRESNEFEWDSHVGTDHSKAIVSQPTIAISIWTPEGDTTIQYGFYAVATAGQISEPNEHGIARYRSTVTKSWVNDATFVKREVSIT